MKNCATNSPTAIGEVDIDELVARSTPTKTEVADWHFIDQVLRTDWQKPLVTVLKFVADLGPADAELTLTPLDTSVDSSSETEVAKANSRGPVIDLTKSSEVQPAAA